MPNFDTGRGAVLVLSGIAFALSSVTALSVALAMGALIADPVLSWVFGAAAVLLDIFKYLAWPIALGLLVAGRRGYAGLMIGTALILGAVSAWATYDRLLTSMHAGQARQAAIAEQRLVDLQAVRADAVRRLEALDAEAASIGDQARQLRERGIVTKALELEASAMTRIAEQRERTVRRLDQASAELTALRSQVASSVELPEALSILLCAGFAVALEVVPALILSALRMGLASVPAVAGPVAPVANESAAATAATTPVVEPATLVAVPATGQQQDLFGPQDDELFERLRSITRATPPGTPITVRDVTAAFRVGNRRAQRLFAAALDLGLMRKTTSGYVAA